MLQQSLLQTQAYEVRVQAVKAVTAFVILHEKEQNIFKHFADLLPEMLKVSLVLNLKLLFAISGSSLILVLII